LGVLEGAWFPALAVRRIVFLERFLHAMERGMAFSLKLALSKEKYNGMEAGCLHTSVPPTQFFFSVLPPSPLLHHTNPRFISLQTTNSGFCLLQIILLRHFGVWDAVSSSFSALVYWMEWVM